VTAPAALLTTATVAARLGRPTATLRWWRHIGYGPPSFRVGGRIAYREDRLSEWLTEQEAAEADRSGDPR